MIRYFARACTEPFLPNGSRGSRKKKLQILLLVVQNFIPFIPLNPEQTATPTVHPPAKVLYSNEREARKQR
jgi:hypothetical protein